MVRRKHSEEKGELLGEKYPPRERISLDDFLLYKSPIPIQHTYLWRMLYAQFYHGCCCCCGPGMYHPSFLGAGGSAPSPAPPAPSPAPPAPSPAPPPPNITVDFFDVQIRQFIVGGSFAVDANFEWRAMGAPNLNVSVQVKSSITFRNWTDVLSNQPPVDVGTWSVRGVPGERFHFRAVARDPAGNEAFSRIITI